MLLLIWINRAQVAGCDVIAIHTVIDPISIEARVALIDSLILIAIL